MCPDETIALGLDGTDGAAVTYRAAPRTFNFGTPEPRAERVVIPETANDTVISRLPIRQFAEGERLGSGDGIVEICVDIEHDYIGDLSMWVTCPDGSRVDLMVRDPLEQGARENSLVNQVPSLILRTPAFPVPTAGSASGGRPSTR